MATATEEVLADLVDRAASAIQRWLDRAISSVQEALAPILEETLFLGEARTSLDSETAREELRRLLAELPDHPRDPATGRSLTEGEAELLRRMENLPGGQFLVLPQGTTVHSVHPNPNLAALSRLLWLLDLSEGERGFVRAAADQPCDLDGLSVFADWLEEQQRVETERFREVALAGIRRLNPQPGEVYAVSLPPSQLPEIKRQLVDSLLDYWKGQRNGAVILFLPHGHDISLLTDEQLAAAGLVRKDGLAERDKQGIKKHTGS